MKKKLLFLSVALPLTILIFVQLRGNPNKQVRELLKNFSNAINSNKTWMNIERIPPEAANNFVENYATQYLYYSSLYNTNHYIDLSVDKLESFISSPPPGADVLKIHIVKPTNRLTSYYPYNQNFGQLYLLYSLVNTANPSATRTYADITYDGSRFPNDQGIHYQINSTILGQDIRSYNSSVFRSCIQAVVSGDQNYTENTGSVEVDLMELQTYLNDLKTTFNQPNVSKFHKIRLLFGALTEQGLINPSHITIAQQYPDHFTFVWQPMFILNGMSEIVIPEYADMNTLCPPQCSVQ